MRKLLALVLTTALVVQALPHVAAAPATPPGSAYTTVSDRPCTRFGLCPYGDLPLAEGGDAWVLPSGDALMGFYMSGSQEIVLPPNYTQETLVHEGCHAMIGSSVEGLNFPTTQIPFDLSPYAPDQYLAEDAARTCAAYQLDPEWLEQVSPERYAWAETWIR